jgi:hypothetical protein
VGQALTNLARVSQAAMIKSAAGELDMESDHFYMYIYKVCPFSLHRGTAQVPG